MQSGNNPRKALVGEQFGWVFDWLTLNNLYTPERCDNICQTMPAIPGPNAEQATYDYLLTLFPAEIEALGDKAFLGIPTRHPSKRPRTP